MDLELSNIAMPGQAEVAIEIRIKTQLNVTAQTAQRKVSKLLLDEVGNQLYGERPNLVAGDKLLWRVPIWLGLPSVGAIGQIGHLDVDAQSGEIYFTQQLLDNLAEQGNVLAQRPSPPSG